jgi:hypothetical protein
MQKLRQINTSAQVRIRQTRISAQNHYKNRLALSERHHKLLQKVDHREGPLYIRRLLNCWGRAQRQGQAQRVSIRCNQGAAFAGKHCHKDRVSQGHSGVVCSSAVDRVGILPHNYCREMDWDWIWAGKKHDDRNCTSVRLTIDELWKKLRDWRDSL